MTKDQEQIITFLFVKYGGWQALVDMWLYDDHRFTSPEMEAVEAWLATEQASELGITGHNEPYKYVSVKISLEVPEKD